MVAPSRAGAKKKVVAPTAGMSNARQTIEYIRNHPNTQRARDAANAVRAHPVTRDTVRIAHDTRGVLRPVPPRVQRSHGGRILRQVTVAAIIGGLVLNAGNASGMLKWATGLFHDVSRLAE